MIATPAWKAWLITAVACLVIEILPPPTHFFFLCLALGAIGAAVTVLFSSIPWLPWVVFVVASVALVPLLVPLAKFLFSPKPHASNVDALAGQKALVTSPIEPKAAGQVKVHGESWRAVSEGESLAKDAWAEIVRVEGAHVVVKSWTKTA